MLISDFTKCSNRTYFLVGIIANEFGTASYYSKNGLDTLFKSVSQENNLTSTLVCNSLLRSAAA